MKSKMILSVIIAGIILGWASHSLAAGPYSIMNDAENKPILLALNCIKPIKPILPIKPIWCTGTWTLILQCDQYCNCVWVPTCVE